MNQDTIFKPGYCTSTPIYKTDGSNTMHGFINRQYDWSWKLLKESEDWVIVVTVEVAEPKEKSWLQSLIDIFK